MGFFDGGGKTAQFNGINQGVAGIILGQHDASSGRQVPYLESQQTNFTTKKLEFYEDGNPIMQAVIMLKTEERADEDDDGVRSVYVNKTRMKRAIKAALTAAGGGDLQIGGGLAIWMTGEEVTPAGMRAKTFEANYAPPAGGLAATPEPPAAAAPVAPAPPAVAAPVAPAPPAVAAPAAPAPVAPPVAAPAVTAAPVAPVAPPAVAPVAPVAPAPVAPVAPAPAAPVAPAPAAPAVSGSESDLPF